MIRSVSRSVVVPTQPQAVFALLADPRRHAEIDGSGTVLGALKAPERLSQGAKFGMKMRLGLPYSISNEVVEFEENKRIAWRHVGHHVWRYELEPVDGGTRVTETFDWAPARSPWVLERLRVPARNARSIDATLERLGQRFA